MNTIRFAALSLSLLAAACGGADFQTGAPGSGDGATPDAETDGSGTGGSPADGATPGTGGAENASGGARATGGTGGRPGTGGATAAGGAGAGGAGGATAAGGSPGTGGAPETGGATGTGGAPVNGGCPTLICPVTCKEDLGTCCLGPSFARTGCGCTFLTGDPSTPVGCHQE